jgi:hypothetical protein
MQAADTPADGQAEDDAAARQQAEQRQQAERLRQAEQLRRLDALTAQAEGPWQISLADLDQLRSGMNLSGGDWALLRAFLQWVACYCQKCCCCIPWMCSYLLHTMHKHHSNIGAGGPHACCVVIYAADALLIAG